MRVDRSDSPTRASRQKMSRSVGFTDLVIGQKKSEVWSIGDTETVLKFALPHRDSSKKHPFVRTVKLRSFWRSNGTQ